MDSEAEGRRNQVIRFPGAFLRVIVGHAQACLRTIYSQPYSLGGSSDGYAVCCTNLFSSLRLTFTIRPVWIMKLFVTVLNRQHLHSQHSQFVCQLGVQKVHTKIVHLYVTTTNTHLNVYISFMLSQSSNCNSINVSPAYRGQ